MPLCLDIPFQRLSFSRELIYSMSTWQSSQNWTISRLTSKHRPIYPISRQPISFFLLISVPLLGSYPCALSGSSM
ncbi:hypothetical protein BDV09DRAFT_38828 [Aspergillus tetrazonus]